MVVWRTFYLLCWFYFFIYLVLNLYLSCVKGLGLGPGLGLGLGLNGLIILEFNEKGKIYKKMCNLRDNFPNYVLIIFIQTISNFYQNTLVQDAS